MQNDSVATYDGEYEEPAIPRMWYVSLSDYLSLCSRVLILSSEAYPDRCEVMNDPLIESIMDPLLRRSYVGLPKLL
jgi:hypothetical protein